MKTEERDIFDWSEKRIDNSEIVRYLRGGEDFIREDKISFLLNVESGKAQDKARVRDIIAKSLSVQTLSLEETAALIQVKDPDIWEEMKEAALAVKKKVYDNRIVTFAPLYLSNLCVNNCVYCGFRKENDKTQRRKLSLEQVREETGILAGKVGHKRLIVVYGEHPETDIDYMSETIREIYGVKVKTRKGWGAIRRVNVNAAPLSIGALKKLSKVGIGTYQVFQETYHKSTYARLHPESTIKSNYLWRLYAMHRAFDAGIDDVGIGVLFGLYDWKFEILGLLSHALELEGTFGIGPHTISFPRLEPAVNTPFVNRSGYRVPDRDFMRIITILRLAVPYTGLIITARENSSVRSDALCLGITQTDASSRIGVGAYSDKEKDQQERRQQFILGDTRSLDSLIRELAFKGYITSFCTAGYRCGRTGKKIMDLLRSGEEGRFCKLNAVLTFREWLDDFAGEDTKQAAREVIRSEMAEIKEKMPGIFPRFMEYYNRVSSGERDLYF